MLLYYRLAILVMMSVVSATAQAAETIIEVQRAVILTTMTEATIAAASLINDRSRMQVDNVSWSATYAEREWELTAQGKLKSGEPFELALLGYLWGGDSGGRDNFPTAAWCMMSRELTGVFCPGAGGRRL
jgi:hypothetical protein